MRKQGQITIFIMVGVVITLLAIFLYSLAGLKTKESIELPFERGSIETFITNCVKDTTEKGVVFLGKQGGYTKPNSFVASDLYEIAYLYDKGKNKVPTKAAVEADLGSYIDQNMISCLDNFDSFEQLGWKVTYEQPKTKVQLNEKDISVVQTFLVSVQRDSVITFQQFSYTLPVRLSYMLDISKEIVNFHLREPEWTDLTELSKHDVEVSIFPYKQKLMYSIKDPQSSIKSESYRFNFALDFE